MTALNSDILFNNSTGSDTAASGCGPATAVSGTGASTISGNAAVTGIDTTGVVAGDLLWVDSLSGRQFIAIAGVLTGTSVTLDFVMDNTESGLNWGIGGKRVNPFSAVNAILFQNGTAGDAQLGWEIDIEETGTNYTLDVLVVFNTVGSDDNPLVIKSTSLVKPVLDPNEAVRGYVDSFSMTNSSHVLFDNVIIENQSATPISSIFFIRASCSIVVSNSIVSNSNSPASTFANFFAIENTNNQNATFYKTLIRDFETKYIMSSGGTQLRSTLKLLYCTMRNCLGVTDGTRRQTTLLGCTFDDCGPLGIDLNASYAISMDVQGCVFYAGTGNGITITQNNALNSVTVTGNIFVGNVGDAIAFTVAATNLGVFNENAYYNNAGNMTGTTGMGIDDILLTADPFVDAVAGDFNINNTAGGGAVLRSTVVLLP